MRSFFLTYMVTCRSVQNGQQSGINAEQQVGMKEQEMLKVTEGTGSDSESAESDRN